MRQIVIIVILSLLVVAISQIAGMTSANADIIAPNSRGSSKVAPVVKAAGNTVLQAATDGDLEKLKKAIKAKVDVNAQDENGETALIKATADSRADIVKELIKAKANVNLKDAAGNTALLYAVSANSIELSQILVSAKADLLQVYGEKKESLLFECARVDSDKIADLLIRTNPKILKIQNADGESALHEAARMGSPKFAKVLVAKGLSGKSKNTLGKTALEIAQQNKFLSTAKALDTKK